MALALSADNDSAVARYSSFSADALTISAQRLVSDAMNAPNSAGSLPTGLAPSLLRRSLICGELMAATVAFLRAAMTSGGVPFGTTKPYHALAS